MNIIFNSQNRLYIFVFAFCSLCFTAVLLPQETFLFLVQEDGPFEWAGATFFLLTSILFFLLFFRKSSFKKAEDAAYFNAYKKRIFFFLLGLLFLILLGEEISWGQRIFGFETPENLAERNMQSETNLHNLDIFHLQKSRPGEEKINKTGLAALLTAKKIFVYIFISFLFLLPLGVRFVPLIRDLTKRFYVPVPAIQIGVLFILNILVYKAFKPLATGYHGIGRGLEELEEFNFALILFLVPFVWLSFSTSPKKRTTEQSREDDEKVRTISTSNS
jgi:hypothetical protein